MVHRSRKDGFVARMYFYKVKDLEFPFQTMWLYYWGTPSLTNSLFVKKWCSHINITHHFFTLLAKWWQSDSLQSEKVMICTGGLYHCKQCKETSSLINSLFVKKWCSHITSFTYSLCHYIYQWNWWNCKQSEKVMICVMKAFYHCKQCKETPLLHCSTMWQAKQSNMWTDIINKAELNLSNQGVASAFPIYYFSLYWLKAVIRLLELLFFSLSLFPIAK